MPISNPFSSRHDKRNTPDIPLVSGIVSPYDSGAETSEAAALLPFSEVENKYDLSEEPSDLHDVPLPRRRNKRLRSVLSFLLSTTEALLPAYLTTFLSWMASLFSRLMGRAVDRPKQEPPRPTAYLDGLRGVAALIVYMYHAVYLFYPRLYHGYGVDHENRFFWQLPIIRVLHSGGGSVCVFFVISGFVLTISPLTKIHKRANNSDVLATAVGTIFRRPFRLFLPIIASTLMNALAQYNRLKFMIRHGGAVREPEATLWLQLVDWYWATVDHIDRFRHLNGRLHLKGHKYDGHTWTIPFEVKGSLLVLIVLMMFSKVKRWVHVVVASGITYWLVVTGDIDSAVFFCGMLLAELSIVAPGRAGPSENCSTDKSPRKSTRGLRYLKMMRHVAIIFLFIFSLHLLSFPDSIAPGFEFLRFAPEFYTDPKSPVSLQTFWHSVGAVLFMLALMYSPSPSSLLPCWSRRPWRQTSSLTEQEERTPPEPLFQRLFTTTFTQYLGRLSYSLYLMHGLINESLGATLLTPALKAWAKTEAAAKALADAKKVGTSEDLLREGNAKYQADFLYFIVVNTLVLFWVSDLFTRFVDRPAVRFTRWLSTVVWEKVGTS